MTRRRHGRHETGFDRIAQALARELADRVLETMRVVWIRDDMRATGWYTEEEPREAVPELYALESD